MSKAGTQAITILYASNGTLLQMFAKGATDESLIQLADSLSDRIINAIIKYPVMGDRGKHRTKASKLLVEWSNAMEDIKSKVDFAHSLAVLMFLLHDLYQKTKNKNAKEMLDTLLYDAYCMQYIHNYECDEWEVYTEAEKIVQRLYKIIGFEQDNSKTVKCAPQE